MKKHQHYCATDPDWATAYEWIVNDPKRRTTEHYEFAIETDNPILFLVAVVSTPQDGVPLSPGTTIELGELGTGVPLRSQGAQTVYPGKAGTLQIVEKPMDEAWRVTMTHGSRPFAVSTMAFHPSATASTTPTTKCRVCRHTAKALALSVVAATGAVATPALISAVGVFLASAGATAAAAAAAGAAAASGGVTSTAVAAFIASMAGDPAATVAQKLCNYVRLCP